MSSGMCYFSSNERSSWETAQKSCGKINGKLAEPRDKIEAKALNGYHYWLGIRRINNK